MLIAQLRSPNVPEPTALMLPPSVSIVIPCFNQGRYLRDALDSAFAQTRPAHEIIVVDDGSTDETAAVAASRPGITYLRQPNLGLARARNAGIQAATGDFLVFLDADDRLVPEAVAVGVEELEERPACALVFGRCTRIDARGAALPTVAPPPIEGDVYTAFLQNNWIWTPAVAMFRRTVAAPFLRFDPAMGAAADYDMYLRIARQAPIHGHGRLVAEYRLHDASMSSDAGVMLGATLRALRAQRRYASRTARRRRAYQAGLRNYRHHYGRQLAAQIVSEWRRPQRWPAMLKAVVLLLRHHPGGVVRQSARAVQRLILHGTSRRRRADVRA